MYLYQSLIYNNIEFFFSLETLKSHEECIYNCFSKAFYDKYHCLPNPRIDHKLSLIDINRINDSLCDQIHEYIEDKHCIRKCRKQCNEEYFDLLLNQKEIENNNKNFIRVKARNLPIFQYRFQEKYSFLLYITNIGGFIGLWFGLAVIDIHMLFNIIVKSIKDYLLKYLITDYLINEFKRVSQLQKLWILLLKIKLLLKNLEKLKLKLLVNIICCLCLLRQIQDITQQYLQFLTNNFIDIRDYIDSDGNIEVNSLPSLKIIS